MVLSEFAGSWVGSNGFRLMPDHPLAEFPATMTVATAAGGHLTSVAYSWQHPDDGPQDGLLVIAAAGEDGSLMAVWGDSWHQKPVPMSLPGGPGAGDTFQFEGDYGGGWRWRIVFDAADTATLRMRMDNVIPADQATAAMAAGPYPVMVMEVRRA
ncbi:hypothetical protein M2302_005118 [Micromonospora sp. A200]|uniref:hypothetical protein n=1 Tax=Micromonospora sp. A200 TaxID=2940568 RepID=UPI0024753DCD|nr:hypothetical protein [Micromonospora sp. A200]MDH6464917.1 hypothetical protein [Micromonospora sp. A200]